MVGEDLKRKGEKMAIDVSKIDGYTEMTAEEKVAALEQYEMDLSGYVKKDIADKYASEAADYKRKLKTKMTDEEAAREKEAAERQAMMEELETLKRDKQVSDNISKLLALGYDKEIAEKSASALADGDVRSFFELQGKHQESMVKALKAELMKQMPKPPASDAAHSKNYLKMAEEALASGNITGAAYYSRLAQEQ